MYFAHAQTTPTCNGTLPLDRRFRHGGFNGFDATRNLSAARTDVNHGVMSWYAASQVLRLANPIISGTGFITALHRFGFIRHRLAICAMLLDKFRVFK